MVLRKLNRSKKLICLFFFLVFFVSFLCLFFFAYTFLEKFDSLSKDKTFEAVEARMDSVFSELNVFPRNTLQDLIFLSSMDETYSIFTGDREHYQDLIEFIKNNPAYYELIFVNSSGECLFDFSSYNFTFDCKNSLPNVTSYASNLEKVKISDIYLDSFSKVPTLEYSSKVYSDKQFLGYIILKVDASYFLEDIRREQRTGEEFFLIRPNGEYLANKNSSKEFNKDVNFYTENNLSLESFEYSNKRFIQNNEETIFFKRISISSGYFSQEVIKGENYWYLVSKERDLRSFNFSTYFILLLLFGFCFLFSFLLFLTVYWRKLWK